LSNDASVSGVPEEPEATGPRRRPGLLTQLVPWAIAIACFAYLYFKVHGVASGQDLSVFRYLARTFSGVDWNRWLMLMVPYSACFFLIDSFVVWRVINWFNAPVRYRDILPVRGSSYILSIVNEQVGKGAMALYLNRRYGVPGWEVGSSMLFIMFCEFYYLLTWALFGWMLERDSLPAVFDAVPVIALVAYLFFPLFLAFFHGRFGFGEELRNRPIFKAFREGRTHQVLTIMAMRSPAIILAIVVYTYAIRLFGLDHVTFAEMAGVLPVIFFGAATPGPMRIVAISLWVALFPAYAGQMTAFGFVQHNFFIFFNAAIGLLFLRRANRELFEGTAGGEGSGGGTV
jgi:hypothetical protein